jgi:hypothetical protein
MAVLAIAGLGAGLGSVVGIGASAGWLIGSIIGNLLFAPGAKSTTQEGPRLGDLTVTSSAYGQSIPWGYGTARLAGNIIWSNGLREQKNVTSQKVGGKGGKSATSTQVTYSYFCSFAVAFAEGPCDALLRIWADSKLIYDSTSTTTPPNAISNLKFRFYTGDEGQLPDGLIESVIGDGDVPAHRGLCYVVFDDMPLANFANRLPNITAELVFTSAAPVNPIVVWTPIVHETAGRFTASGNVAIDFKRNVFYAMNAGGGGMSVLRRINYVTMVEDRVVLATDLLAAGTDPDWFSVSTFCMWVGPDGYIYGALSAANGRPIIKVDPNTLHEVARFGTSNNNLSNSTTSFQATFRMCMARASAAAGDVDFLICCGVGNAIGVLRASDMTYVWGEDELGDGRQIDENRFIGAVSGKREGESGSAWVLGGGLASGGASSPTLGIYRFDIDADASYEQFATTPVPLYRSSGTIMTKTGEVAVADVDVGATVFVGGSCVGSDPTDGGFIVGVQTDGVVGLQGIRFIMKILEDGTLVWKTQAAVWVSDLIPSIGDINRLDGTTFSWIDTNTAYTIDLRSGEITTAALPGATDAGSTQFFDSYANSVTFRNGFDDSGTGSTFWKKVFLGRKSANTEVLSAIVTDLCERVGLGVTDIDVTGLTDEVTGYIVSRPSSPRDAIQPLASAYLFDGVESDYLLKFPKRGAAPVATILRSGLAPIDSEKNEAVRRTRVQEVELPERVSVIYMDKDLDYQQGTVSDKRVSSPVPAMAARQQTQIELPIVMTAGVAKQIAQKQLYTAWVEREGYSLSMAWDLLALDPSDNVIVDDGIQLFVMRLVKTEFGLDMTIGVEALAQDVATYLSSVSAGSGLGLPVQQVPGTPSTKLFMMDLPLLRDIDDSGGLFSQGYFAMSGLGQDNWPGGIMMRSLDNTSFTEAGQSNFEAAWGTVVGVLGSPPTSPFAPDETSELRVYMVHGKDQLESKTELEVLNGANAAVLLRADGTPEIIQFRDVTLNDDGSVTLSWLIRGRRGTDVFCEGHEDGETFLLLEPDTVDAIRLGLGELDKVRYYKGVGFGGLFEEADLETRTNTGRDLMPWAPVHVTAAENAGDIDLAWVRRSRTNGAMEDFTSDVPLSEASEAYEVDILSGPGGTLKRTLASATASVAYDSADITTDFGSVPATLTLRVYQISEAVGRGFSFENTVEVT